LFLLYFREGSFWNAWDSETSGRTPINSISSEQLPEMNTGITQLHETTTTPFTDIHQNVPNNCDLDRNFLSYQQLMDLFLTTADNAVSVSGQTGKSIDTVSNDRNKIDKCTHFLRNERNRIRLYWTQL
jgi:hypothetical protein